MVVAAVAAMAPLLAPHDPRLSTGRPLAPPTREHLLGTNDLGQDVLSQVIHGARSVLIVAGLVTGASTALSWLVGLAAGFVRRAEAPLMLVTDLLLVLPSMPLYFLVLTVLGASRRNLIAVLALLSWPAFARIVRSVVLQTRSAAYVEASRALGAADLSIVRRHVLPATLQVLPTKLVLTVRFAIFGEATLAFLGLGGSGSISWGTMLGWAFADPLLFARPVWPWLVLPPALAIVAVVLATVWVTTDTGDAGGPGSSRRPDRANSPRRFGHRSTAAGPLRAPAAGSAWLPPSAAMPLPRDEAVTRKIAGRGTQDARMRVEGVRFTRRCPPIENENGARRSP